MRYSLTVAFITSRVSSGLGWFLDSLAAITPRELPMSVIVIDAKSYGTSKMDFHAFRNHSVTGMISSPKPTIWQGPSRITRENWWAKSNALNTAICLCQTDWIAFVDDRCVLSDHWLTSIEEAMERETGVVGSYEKRANMKVENGIIVDEGELLGADTRTPGVYQTDGWYGGSGALPLEWCLAVNGLCEDVCDGLGSEDSMFGVTLRNSGFPFFYDSRMRIIEDRTPGQIDGALRRSDWGVSPNDASHKIVEILRDKTTSQNSFDIRNLRDRVLSGEPFPPPSASHIHWFSGEPIAEKFV